MYKIAKGKFSVSRTEKMLNDFEKEGYNLDGILVGKFLIFHKPSPEPNYEPNPKPVEITTQK